MEYGAGQREVKSAATAAATCSHQGSLSSLGQPPESAAWGYVGHENTGRVVSSGVRNAGWSLRSGG